MLPGLPVLGDASLELTSARGNDEHPAVSLAGPGDHVLDEVTMAGGVDDGHIVPKDRKLIGNLKLPECDWQ